MHWEVVSCILTDPDREKPAYAFCTEQGLIRLKPCQSLPKFLISEVYMHATILLEARNSRDPRSASLTRKGAGPYRTYVCTDPTPTMRGRTVPLDRMPVTQCACPSG